MNGLDPRVQATIREYVEAARRRAKDDRDLSVDLWHFLLGWSNSSASDAELGAVVRVLEGAAAQGGEPRG